MKRRSFFQAAAALLAGAKGAFGAEQRSKVDAAESTPRSVLITSAEHDVARAIASNLAKVNRVRLTSSVDVRTDHPFTRSDLDHSSTTDDLVRDIDAIVHVALPPPGADGEAQIDYRTRQTYNLLVAAAAQDVEKVVLLSSLRLLTDYDEEYEVTEDWRPFPSGDPDILSSYLAEFTCREFARERKLKVIVLRVGTVVHADKVAGKPYDPLWVDERDVAQAVEAALGAEFQDSATRVGHWRVFHVQSDSRRARFTSARAKSALKFAPQHFSDK